MPKGRTKNQRARRWLWMCGFGKVEGRSTGEAWSWPWEMSWEGRRRGSGEAGAGRMDGRQVREWDRGWTRPGEWDEGSR